MDQKMHMLTHKIDAITGVYDDLHEKMHEIDKTRKNNLMVYGIKPDFLPEIQIQLENKIKEIFKHHLSIGRDIPTTKISRLLTGKKFDAFYFNFLRLNFPERFFLRQQKIDSDFHEKKKFFFFKYFDF